MVTVLQLNELEAKLKNAFNKQIKKAILDEKQQAEARELVLLNKISSLEKDLATQSQAMLTTIREWVGSLTNSIDKANQNIGAITYRMGAEEKRLEEERNLTPLEDFKTSSGSSVEDLEKTVTSLANEIKGLKATVPSQSREPINREWGSMDSLASPKRAVGDEDLTESVEFLNVLVEGVRGDVNYHSREIESMDDDIRFLIDKVTYLEDYSRRDNIKFFRVPEQYGETWEDCEAKVTEIVCKDMNLEALKNKPMWGFVRAHRVGKFNPNKIRPIVAKFYDFKIKQEVMGNAGVLNDGEKYSCAEDFSVATSDLRKKLYEKSKDDKSVKLVYNRLVKKAK